MKTRNFLSTTSAIAVRLLSAVNHKIAIASVLAASIVAASATSFTTGTTNVIDPNGLTILQATDATVTSTTFASDIATAYANNTGGVWNFDAPSGWSLANGDNLTLTYGGAQTNSLVLAYSESGGGGLNQGNVGSGQATSGSFILGQGGSVVDRTFTPNKPLLEVGIISVNRGDASRIPSLVVTFLDGTTATTSGANMSAWYFHGFATNSSNPIVKFTLHQSGNLCRYDDLGFVVATAPIPPTITTQPASQNLYTGDPLLLSAAAVGSSLAYQWQSGAPGSGIYTNVPGATSATLTNSWVTTSLDYILIVTNTSGSVTSSVAAVTVNAPTYVNGFFNGDFELPAVGKINGGFDVAGVNGIPGWRNAGPNQTDCGIEDSGRGHNGTWGGYLQTGQSGAYQMTTNVVHQAGEVITLTWWAVNSYNAGAAQVSLLGASSQSAAFGSTTALASRTDQLTGVWYGTWTQYVLTYTASAGDVGKYLGAVFAFTNTTTGGWGNFDDFSMTITPPTAPPVILNQPASHSAWLASTTTFTVLANGSGLNYQWQAGAVGSGIYTNISNGGQFSGANTATLTISNVSLGNNLDYVVTVSNVGGSVTNDTPATLSVILDAPYMGTVASKTVNQYDSTTLSPSYVTGAMNYQWMAGAVGSGIYTNLVNGGRFSGVNTATLSISNVQPADGLDYVLVASNVSGSTTNTSPATLTVITIIYLETFTTTNSSIADIGWVADAINGMYQNIDNGNNLVMYNTGSGAQAFYTTTKLDTGATGLAFPVINVTNVTGLTFSVDNQSWWNPDKLHTYLAVQMNGGQWYASVAEITQATSSTATQTMAFDPTASSWNELTVSGTGGTNSASVPLIGSAATNNLSGYITGAGLVLAATTDSAYVHYDNFKITGEGFTILPGLSMTSSGSTVTLTWGYGTLIESDSVTGPWTPVSGATSPKTVSSSTGTHFFALQLP